MFTTASISLLKINWNESRIFVLVSIQPSKLVRNKQANRVPANGVVSEQFQTGLWSGENQVWMQPKTLPPSKQKKNKKTTFFVSAHYVKGLFSIYFCIHVGAALKSEWSHCDINTVHYNSIHLYDTMLILHNPSIYILLYTSWCIRQSWC